MTKLRSGVDWSSDLKCNDERHAIRMDGLSLVEESVEFGKLPCEGPADPDSPRGAATNRTKRTVDLHYSTILAAPVLLKEKRGFSPNSGPTRRILAGQPLDEALFRFFCNRPRPGRFSPRQYDAVLQETGADTLSRRARHQLSPRG